MIELRNDTAETKRNPITQITKEKENICNKIFDILSENVDKTKIDELNFLKGFFKKNINIQQALENLIITTKEASFSEIIEFLIYNKNILNQIGEENLDILKDILITDKIKNGKVKNTEEDEKGKTLYGDYINNKGFKIPFWYDKKKNKYIILDLNGEELTTLINIERKIDKRKNKNLKKSSLNEGEVLSGIFLDKDWNWLPFELDGSNYTIIRQINGYHIKSVGKLNKDSKGKIISGNIKTINNKWIPFWKENDEFKTPMIKSQTDNNYFIIYDTGNIERFNNFENNFKVLHGDFKTSDGIWLPFWYDNNTYKTIEIKSEKIIKLVKVKKDKKGLVIEGEFINSKGKTKKFYLKNGKYIIKKNFLNGLLI
ncbi:MAG: hypothetical protein PHN31_04960 [Candidatus Gracilibacteria bacterium]|nr:hypothetical protein [Candidatus Gracilibacteria bacterium]